MGVGLMNIVIKMRNGVIFTMKGCFRSVCKHPFLVFLLSVLIYMYRSSPFVFSLLVSASPILVCTAVLLGTLLFFGQPNVPEIVTKEEKPLDFTPQKTELSKDENKGELEKPNVNVGSSLSDSKRVEISSVDVAKIGEVMEENRELDERTEEEEVKSEWNDGGVSDGDVMDSRKTNDQESDAESFDSEMVNVDSLASSGRSSWKQVEHRGFENDEDDDESLADSSSPDESMADMIPMLDELHPLLDEDVPLQPIQMSRACSEAVSEAVSERSSISSVGSIDETDNQEGEEDEEDDEDDDVAARETMGFRTKSAITWTEEDQKNLMEVGSSEIERNQRLERVILRRKSRKHMSMVPEMNLIDLESSEGAFPINIASISTARKNPFDMPDEAYAITGLPPIPGSAPSILLPRRNPFDVPYDEEKESTMGDGSQDEEHKGMQSRDPFFRRRENLSAGPSVFAPDGEDLKLRPYFVSERMDLEETGYESKVSSVPDTESTSSVEEEGTQDNVSKMELSEEDAPPPLHVAEDVGHGSQSSEGEEECVVELGSIENIEESDVKFQPETEAVEQKHSRGSSISSLSEVSHKEPVYDSSPTKRVNDDIISDFSGENNIGGSIVPTGEQQVKGKVKVERSVDNKETPMSPTSDADFEEACEKISTPTATTAGGSASAPHFYVRAMHEKEFEHLDEVQVPNTPVEPSEKARGIQTMHIPELQEQLDHVSPKTKSSVIPKPSEESVGIQTKNEDAANEIKNIRERQLSELDGVEEKPIDAARVSETSDINGVEVNSNPVEVNKMEQDISGVEVNPNSVEVNNKMEHEMNVENSRDEILDIGGDHKKELMLTEKEETVESPVGEEEESGVREDDPHSTSDTETDKNKNSSSFSNFWAKRRLSTPFF